MFSRKRRLFRAMEAPSFPGRAGAELKNAEQEIRTFHLRLVAATALVMVCFGLLLARFVYLHQKRMQ